MTVTNGLCQAVDNGAVFVEYLPEARGLSFAVDAKAFIDALSVLKDFVIIVKPEVILLVDEEQEVTLSNQPSDIPVASPKGVWLTYDFAADWAVINEFTNAAFPAILCDTNTLETATQEYIVRFEAESVYTTQRKLIITYKLPKHSQAYCFAKDFLWIQYNDTCFVGLKYLNINYPDTSSYFTDWDSGSLIPSKLYTKLTPAEFAKFSKRGLKLITEKISTNVIEGVAGQGKYSYSIFAKALKYGISWKFNKKTLNVSGTNIKVVLENIDA